MNNTQQIAASGNLKKKATQDKEESECSETNDCSVPKKILNKKK